MTEAFFQPSQRFHELELYTDASNFGWGGHVDTPSASGKWPVLQSNWHINRLEVEAGAISLREFLPHLRGKAVRFFTDNTTVAFYVNKQGGWGVEFDTSLSE